MYDEESIDDLTFHVVNIYSPRELDEKRVLWSRLMQIVLGHQDENIFIIGDCNSIRDYFKRYNCVYRHNDSFDFNHFIDKTTLMVWH